ncbi:MAG TPA: FkbM family methyltransferase, partial [Saprospiraceae bacterium]|nr:FkbM family methyltransferase [Saprospiraceae bacterium]
KTISLVDLLDEYNAPLEIDFLSIDTEGSEFDILNCFNFEKYTFKVIVVEHNYTPNREKIKNLLESKRYKRVLMNVSQWDDWYLRN